jgi:CelD/BcsL family acetyltransferase involved in cellulose biosynthesis
VIDARAESEASEVGIDTPLLQRGASSIDVRVDRNLDAWEAEAAAFDALNRESSRPDPFVSLEFLRAYLDHDEQADSIGLDLRLLSFREQGELIGYVALRRQVQRIGPAGLIRGARIDFAVTRDHEHPHVVCRPGDEQRLADATVTHMLRRRDWSMLEFQGQRVNSPLHRAVHRVAGPTRWARDIEMPGYHEVPLRFRDTTDYFSSLSKRMRSNVSRQARRLYASGEIELLEVSGPAVATLLPLYLDLEARSWKRGTDVAVGRHPERVRFHEALLGGRVPVTPEFAGIVRNGVLVAAILWSHGFGAAWAHEMAFDEQEEDLGPGQLLLLLATGMAIRCGAARFHFFQQHGYYKHRWLAEESAAVNVQLLRQPSVLAAKGRFGDLTRSLRDNTSSSEYPNGETNAATAQPPTTRDERASSDAAVSETDRIIQAATRVASTQLLERTLHTLGPTARRTKDHDAAVVIPFAMR